MMRGTKQPFQYAQMWGKAGGSHVAQPVPRWVTCDANEFVSLLNAEKLNPCSEDEWRRIMGLLRQTEESQEAKVKRAVNGFVQHCKARKIAPPVVKPEPVKAVVPVKVIKARKQPKSRRVDCPYAPNKATGFNVIPGEITAYLRKHKQATNKELAAGLGREYSSIKDATKRMAARGELQEIRFGKQGVMYRLEVAA